MKNMTQPPKSFGTWLLDVRKQRNLTLQQIADQSGLQTGTISRIERDKVKVTLVPALRICDALNVTPDILYEELGLVDMASTPDNRDNMALPGPTRSRSLHSQNTSSRERSSLVKAHQSHIHRLNEQTPEPSVINAYDVQNFRRLVAESPDQAQALLTDILNRLVAAQRLQDGAVPFNANDSARLLAPLPFYDCDVPYPGHTRTLTTDDLMHIYAAGGMVIKEDADHFIQQAIKDLSPQAEHVPADLQRSLHRLGELALEHTLLDTVLVVDFRLNQNGIFLEQYWIAYQMQEEARLQRNGYNKRDHSFTPWSDTEVRHISLFVKLHRWLYVSGETDASWMRQSFLQS
jgi:transcriptional regulator with XRE-family HTH domain